MSGRLQTNGMWTKMPDQLADDLDMGLITLEEYAMLVYMIQRADKETGIFVTNSGLLVNRVHKDRAWVHNRLTALRKKNRIQNPTSDAPQLNQKRGNRNPYPMRLSDHLGMNVKTSGKPEPNQSQTSGKPLRLTSQNDGDVDESQSGQGGDAVGIDVAPERDLDLEGDKNPPNPPDTFTTVNGLEVIEEELAGVGGGEPFDPDSKCEPGTNEKVTTIQRLIFNKYKSQLLQPPGYGPCNDMLQEFGGDLTWIECGITAAPTALKQQTPTAAVNLVRSVAMRLRDNPGNAGQGGAVGGSIGDIRRAKEAANLALMKEELVELEAKTDGDWSEHILAMQVAIAEAEVG